MALSPQTVLRGTDCEVYLDGTWLTNVTSVEATVTINQTDINLLGQIWTQHRNMSLAGAGTMNGVFVSSKLLEQIGSIQNGQEFRTSIIIKNTNPDTGKTYRVALQNVVFSTIPLGSFSAGEIAAQDFSFAFSGYEILDKID